MFCSPVMIRHRASSCGTVFANPSRIAWSSAPRLPGFEIVSRVTPGAGSSTIRRPPLAGRVSSVLLEDNERVTLGHRLALLDEDLLDHARVFGLDRHLHLHRLEDHDRIAFVDAVADLDL